MLEVSKTPAESEQNAAEKMSDIFGPMQVDQFIRQAMQMCWMALPKESRSADELEKQIRRIVDRALNDFRDDAREFGRNKSATPPLTGRPQNSPASPAAP